MGQIISPVASALRQDWKHAALVAVVGAAALAVLMPIIALSSPERPARTVLALAEIPEAGSGIVWTADARPPAALRTAALRDAFLLVAVAGWVTLGMAVIVMLGRTAAATAARAPEFGIRRAVGASRRNLAGGLLFEAAVVVAVMLAVSAVVAWFVTGRAVRAWPGTVADMRVAPWLPVLLAAGAVVTGWLSALRFVRRRYMTRPADPHVSLWVPALQLGLAVAVLMGGWLVLEHGRALAARADGAGGGDGDGLVLALDTGALGVTERARRYGDLLARLERHPAVATARLGHPGAVLGLGAVDDIMTDCGTCMGPGGVWLPLHSLEAVHHLASPDTFASRGMPLVEGRGFTAADRIGAPAVVVVNRHLAGRHFESGNAVGRGLWLRTGFWRRPYTVIGVVDDDRAAALGGATQPREALYLATLQHPPARAELFVRASGAAPAPRDDVLSAVAETLGAGGIVRGVTGEREVRAREARVLGWFGAGLAGAGVVTLVVGVIGVFGTTRLWVRSQAFELALRRAVGASRVRLAASLYGRATLMGVGGAACGGVLFALVVRGVLTLVVPGLPLWAPELFGLLTALLLVVALSAATSALVPMLRERPAARLQ